MVIVAEEIVSTWGTFRVVHENNDWFMVGNDIAAILQYTNCGKTIRDKVSDENKHKTLACSFSDIPLEYRQYAIRTNDPNYPFIVDFDKLNRNIQ